MKVHSDLPSHLQQGIFRSGATYPVIARYANEPSFVLPDNTNAPRGLGMKVFGVSGDRLLPDQEGLGTQDFLYNNAPMVELTNVKTTLEIQELREKYFDDPTQLKVELGKRSDRSKQFAPSMLPNTYLIGGTMYSQGECEGLQPQGKALISSRICVRTICGQIFARPSRRGTTKALL